MSSPRAFIIAGANGAGKTAFANVFLPDYAKIERFINADNIAAGLSPFNPEAAAVRAGRLMLAEIDRAVAERADFAIETTLSGRIYLRRIKQWRAMGYRIELLFLNLPSAEIAARRVAQRVQRGGHNIPPDVIQRRFKLGWSNFNEFYQHRVDAWRLYDAFETPPVLLEQGSNRDPA
ncbi:MAG: zeta toxin family protein [Planctomycetota bacterium]